MGKLFGTDGIRGAANHELTADLAYRVGVAVANVLRSEDNTKPSITIGKDTRLSGDMLQYALAAGLCAGGANAAIIGVAPTPAVAFITSTKCYDAGAVISASHNPFQDNGIKIFNSQGFKLSDELEEKIEDIVLNGPLPLVDGENLGTVTVISSELDRYIEWLSKIATVSSKLKIVVDCSNGASSETAERVFSNYASELHIIHSTPDGVNINHKCGSTAPETLCHEVVRLGADIGFAFDGDADRCIACDELGEIIDGDKIMAILSSRMLETGALKSNTLVATVYSNLGLREYASERGIRFLAAPTGDRNVLELMQKEGAVLGGEKSGHIILLDYATTGDGQLAAVKFLEALTAQTKSVSELRTEVKTYPQELINVKLTPGSNKDAIMNSELLKASIATAESELGEQGRILVRPSGTEPLIRVMVEAPTIEQTKRIANNIAEAVK